MLQLARECGLPHEKTVSCFVFNVGIPAILRGVVAIPSPVLEKQAVFAGSHVQKKGCEQVAKLEKKNFSAPEETRRHPKLTVEVLRVGGTEVLKTTFEPGWTWDEHLRPSAGGSSCQVSHLNYVLSGHMRLKMDDGTETEVGPGDLVSLPAGHTAWVVGQEALIWLDFQGGSHFAK